jgi:hypothetical protein
MTKNDCTMNIKVGSTVKASINQHEEVCTVYYVVSAGGFIEVIRPNGSHIMIKEEQVQEVVSG